MRLKQHGLSLIETLLVIAVITGLVLTVTRLFISTRLNANVNTTLENIRHSVQQSYTWLEQQPQATFAANGPQEITLSNDALIQSGLLLASNFDAPWPGAKINLTPDSNDPSHIRIDIENIPDSACRNLAHRLEGVVYQHQETKPSACQSKTYYGVF